MKLIVLDIDNTLFDWVTYYVNAFTALLSKVESITAIPYQQLASEAKEIFASHHSIEYPFVIQNMPSIQKHYGADLDRLLNEAAELGRKAFNQAALPYLTPYNDVKATLTTLRTRLPHVPIVVLTDAPRYVAMWKLNKIGLLDHFDAVYGLPDPKLPTSTQYGRVMVDPKILLKHLQQQSFGYQGRIRILPDDYEKPGTKGLKTVLIDFEIDPKDCSSVLWVGDNLRKDVSLGKSLGVLTVWARYGTVIAPQIKERLLEFSPESNVKKNVYLDPMSENTPQPDHTIDSFGQILALIP